VIVVSFQPHGADLETMLGWFLSANEDLQYRVVFIPNRLTNTKEQRDVLEELRKILKETGRRRLASVLSNRPAVYPRLLNGRKKNFFTVAMDEKVTEEVQATFKRLLNR
jgi:hypothetical protein